MAEIKSIVVLYGGASSERDISLESGKGIYEAIDQLGYFVKLKDYNNLEKLEDLKKYDLVFIALHGFEGESGILQKNLDNLGILYTGSKYLSCKNTWNKSKFKDILESALIPTPRGFSVERIHSNMQSPFDKFHKEYNEDIKNLFLKPEEDGSSVDIFEVNCESDLEIAIRDAQNPNRAFIFEESIKFKEFTVSILDNKCLPIIEIKTTNNFYDYDAKYISDTTQLIEADLDEKNKNKIHDMALNAFKELGCIKWGRVDILQDKNQHLYILEINTVPGMTSHSCFPRAAEISGISYKELVQIIIEDAHL
jgi:D-alanine-D-alanine ligase